MKDTAQAKQGPPSASQCPLARQNAVAETARAATRPIVTVIFAGTIAGAVLAEIEPPPWFISLAIPCILWYFGERTYMHRKENKQQ